MAKLKILLAAVSDARFSSHEEASRGGPLSGVRVVEFVGIGPGPHCAMLLADIGADVLRIDRPGGNGWPNPVVDRGRHTLELDIRTEQGRATCLEALSRADVLIKGFRPGVMEWLGLGPDEARVANPCLIYGRMTGGGRKARSPLRAEHDLNYVAVMGALAAITEDRGGPYRRAISSAISAAAHSIWRSALSRRCCSTNGLARGRWSMRRSSTASLP